MTLWKKSPGFTLIEVMISMLIMSSLTILISASIRSAVQNKKKLEARIVTETMLYDSLRVIKLDLERAFNYQDVFFQIENLAIQALEKEKSNAANNNNNGNPPAISPAGNSAPPRQPPQKLTHFLGSNEDMHFTTLNHFRTKYNAQESNQMEVGYYVESCKSRDGKSSSRCLWRRASPIIDDKVDKGGLKVVVAQAVSDFRIEYRSDRENDEWRKEWRSDNKGRNIHRNKFPHFVRIKLALGDKEDPKNRPIEQEVVMRIEFPNNEPLLTQQNTPGAPPGQNGAGQNQQNGGVGQ